MPSRSGGVGSDHLNAELVHRAPELSGALLVDLVACLRREPVVGASVAVERAFLVQNAPDASKLESVSSSSTNWAW
jgi:hypothetical protein